MDGEDELKNRIKQLESELETEKKKHEKKVELKVSPKGCVQINGIRRFPITLYKQEMLKILEIADEINEFIHDNNFELK